MLERTIPHTTAARVRHFTSGFAAFGALLCLYAMRQADPDFWGHLAYGKLFAESGGPGVADPFAYTSAGFRWNACEYLSQIVLWLSYELGGPIGLIGLKFILGGAALASLYVAVKLACDEPWIRMPVFLLAASAIARFFLFRPQIFTFAFFAFFVAVLLAYLLRRKAPLWALPVVMLIWVNSHGGFLAGLGAIGLAILLRASENIPAAGIALSRLWAGTSRLWITLGACLAVTFFNPLGARLWPYLATELSSGTNRRYIAEWAPPSLHGDVWSTVTLYLMTAMLGFAGWAACRSDKHQHGRTPSIYWVLSCVPLLSMSYWSVRHAPMAAIWTAPAIGLLAARASRDVLRLPAFRRSWFVLRGLSITPIVLIAMVVYAEPQPAIRVDRNILGVTHPCGAVAFLKSQGARGNLFTPLWWGSYVTWELYPSIRVSMDGRNVALFSDEMVRENLQFYVDEADRVDVDTPLRYPSDLLIVPSNAPVLRRIHADSRWRRIYADTDAVVFRRSGDEAAAALVAGPDGSESLYKPSCAMFLN